MKLIGYILYNHNGISLKKGLVDEDWYPTGFPMVISPSYYSYLLEYNPARMAEVGKVTKVYEEEDGSS